MISIAYAVWLCYNQLLSIVVCNKCQWYCCSRNAFSTPCISYVHQIHECTCDTCYWCTTNKFDACSNQEHDSTLWQAYTHPKRYNCCLFIVSTYVAYSNLYWNVKPKNYMNILKDILHSLIQLIDFIDTNHMSSFIQQFSSSHPVLTSPCTLTYVKKY